MMVRCAGAATLALVLGTAACAPADAETIFLKNGSQVTGKILKQDAQTFQVQTAQGVVRLPKVNVAVEDPPDPIIAAVLGASFPGAGNAYTGRYDKTAFYLVLSLVTFATSFELVKLSSSDPSSAGLAVLSGVGSALIPWGLGAYDAYDEARRQDAQPTFKIQYGTDPGSSQ